MYKNPPRQIIETGVGHIFRHYIVILLFNQADFA